MARHPHHGTTRSGHLREVAPPVAVRLLGVCVVACAAHWLGSPGATTFAAAPSSATHHEVGAYIDDECVADGPDGTLDSVRRWQVSSFFGEAVPHMAIRGGTASGVLAVLTDSPQAMLQSHAVADATGAVVFISTLEGELMGAQNLYVPFSMEGGFEGQFDPIVSNVQNMFMHIAVDGPGIQVLTLSGELGVIYKAPGGSCADGKFCRFVFVHYSHDAGVILAVLQQSSCSRSFIQGCIEQTELWAIQFDEGGSYSLLWHKPLPDKATPRNAILVGTEQTLLFAVWGPSVPAGHVALYAASSGDITLTLDMSSPLTPGAQLAFLGPTNTVGSTPWGTALMAATVKYEPSTDRSHGPQVTVAVACASAPQWSPVARANVTTYSSHAMPTSTPPAFGFTGFYGSMFLTVGDLMLQANMVTTDPDGHNWVIGVTQEADLFNDLFGAFVTAAAYMPSTEGYDAAYAVFAPLYILTAHGMRFGAQRIETFRTALGDPVMDAAHEQVIVVEEALPAFNSSQPLLVAYALSCSSGGSGTRFPNWGGWRTVVVVVLASVAVLSLGGLWWFHRREAAKGGVRGGARSTGDSGDRTALVAGGDGGGAGVGGDDLGYVPPTA